MDSDRELKFMSLVYRILNIIIKIRHITAKDRTNDDLWHSENNNRGYWCYGYAAKMALILSNA